MDTPSVAPAHSPSLWRSRIWRQYMLVIGSALGLLIGAFGASEFVATYRDAKAQVGLVQQAKAHEVAQALQASLSNIERHVESVTALPWGVGDWLTLDTRRDEYARLLRLVPAVESVSYFDASGREQLLVSRRALDRVASASQAASARASAVAAPARHYGPVEYGNDYDPFVVLRLTYPEAPTVGRTEVRIGLRALAREMKAALTPTAATAYVADREGRIVLHEDWSVMLRRTPAPSGAAAARATAIPAVDARGVAVLRTTQPLDALGWTIFIEAPEGQAMQPVRATLFRTGAFVLIGLLLSGVVAAFLAGQLTRPIRRLHVGALQLQAGRLGSRVAVKGNDELTALAGRFNDMAHSLQESHATLESKVAQKTVDLELANRHKSEFLANMSHELRTPLNAIIGFSDALIDRMWGELTPKQLEYVQDIHGSGEHLLSLINDLLDLAKIESGRIELEREPVHVRSAIDAAMTLLRERAVRQRQSMTAEVEPDVDLWSADPRRFKQILLNLLSNAVKFTPLGGHIAVHAGAHDGLLTVSVTDDGPGIAPEDLPHIFEEFRQVGAPTAQRAEGTGLGLAVVRRLVELHGGSVAVESRPGAGSTFRFTIPEEGPP